MNKLCDTVLRKVNFFKSNRIGFKFLHCHFLSILPWKNHKCCLHHNVLICKMSDGNTYWVVVEVK